jgi:hypothetical protein
LKEGISNEIVALSKNARPTSLEYIKAFLMGQNIKECSNSWQVLIRLA